MQYFVIHFINLLYKYLPIFFGCHCRSNRSFFYKKIQFPICARCTGELIGFLLALGTYCFIKPSIFVLMIMMIPLIVDGTVQLHTSYESNNIVRLLTGILFGYGLMSIIIFSFIWVYQWGVYIGIQIKEK